MKRAFAGLLLASALTGRLLAQDAVALAAQRETEENIKRLSATITEVQAAQEQQHRDIDELKGAVQKIRSDLGKLNQNAIVQELQNTIKKLDDKIMKVDESRSADSKRIFEALKDLGKLVAERPAPPTMPKLDSPPARVEPSPGGSTGPGTSRQGRDKIEEGFEYTIASGDRLDLIVKRYREQNIMVTMKMVQDANPSVKWERLKVGQKIFIPKPAK